MDNIIECNELNYKYQNKVLFQDLTLEIKKGAFVTLIGKRGSGKTTLMKLIAGMLKSNHNIKVAGLYVKEENLLSLHAKIGFVFENPEKNIVANIVRDDILYSVPKGKYSKKSLDLKFQEVINILEIEHFLDKRTSQLSGGEKQLVAIAGILMKGAKIIILDNCFSMVDNITKNHILKKLKVLNRNEKITIIHVTTNMEDSIYGNYIALLGDKKIKFFGKNNYAYTKEELFLEEGIKLPFMVQLSSKLKYYDLISKTILDMNKMVDEVWK